MGDKEKSKKQLIQDLVEARGQIVALEEEIQVLRERLETLAGSEALYRRAAEQAYDWEFWINPAGEFIFSSQACERISGYKGDAFAADPLLLFRIIHPDDLSRVSSNLHRKRAEDGVCGLEYRIVCHDGEVRWLGLAFQSVYDEQGRYLGIRGSNRDITDRKRREDPS